MVLVPLHKDFPIVQTTQPTRMAIAKAKKNGHVDVVKLLIEKKRKVFRSIPKKIRRYMKERDNTQVHEFH